MERYIGIDVHSRTSTVAVMGPSGKRIRCEVVETSGAALVAALLRVAGRRHVCLEEVEQSEWLAEVFRPHCEELVVDATCEQRDRSESKSDERDAWGLADRLRMGQVKRQVYKSGPRLAGLRDAVRGYVMVVGDIVRVKNRLRAVCRARGLVVDDGEELYAAERREERLAGLPESRRELASLLVDELDGLEAVREQAEARVAAEAAEHPAIRRLQTVPGLGPVRAAQVVALAMTPERFRTTRQSWSYCGLGIVTRSSADWVRQGQEWVRAPTTQTRGLTRRRQPLLKAVFKGAALTVIGKMPQHPLAQNYHRLCAAGTKPPLARLTTARKIAAATLAVWSKKEDYDPAKHRTLIQTPT
jgi:transposase